jgi:hypothetical protein
VYDIDHGQKLLRTITVADSGNYEGIVASIRYGTSHLTSANRDELICVDPKSEKVLLRKHWGGYADGLATTPDGRKLYVPLSRRGLLERIGHAFRRSAGANRYGAGEGLQTTMAAGPTSHFSPSRTFTYRTRPRIVIRPSAVHPRRWLVFANVVAEIPDLPARKPHLTNSHGVRRGDGHRPTPVTRTVSSRRTFDEFRVYRQRKHSRIR